MVSKGTDKNRLRKIVSVDDPQDLAELRDALRISNGEIIKELPLINGFLCEFPEEDVVIAVRSMSEKIRMEEDAQFSLCVEKSTYPYPDLFSFFFKKPQTHKPVPTKNNFQSVRRIDWGLKRMGAPQVWNKLNEKRVRVGIIDTGIDYNHADLRKNIREGVCTLDGKSSFMDDYGHGTHVAGVIGANNTNGMVGINPYVDFYIVKAFDKKGSGNLSDIIEGFEWLMRRNVSIINMSFSTSENSQSFVRAVQSLEERGIVLVAAAGNDGGEVNFPARFPQVIAVSAINKEDRIADFSSHGPEINFCAPGVNITSTWIGSGYAEKSGTSFAAPHIAGAVADVINYYGPMTSSQIVSILSEKAVTLNYLNKEQQGAGLVELPQIIN